MLKKISPLRNYQKLSVAHAVCDIIETIGLYQQAGETNADNNFEEKVNYNKSILKFSKCRAQKKVTQNLIKE